MRRLFKKGLAVVMALALSAVGIIGADGLSVKSQAADSTSVYRLCHPNTGEYLYTTDTNEVSVLSTEAGWIDEGIAWYAPNTGTPIYRVNNPGGFHLYTSDKNEVKQLVKKHGWTKDNGGEAMFYSGGNADIYRCFDPVSGRHLLTGNRSEYDYFVAGGWNDEGVKLKAESVPEDTVVPDATVPDTKPSTEGKPEFEEIEIGHYFSPSQENFNYYDSEEGKYVKLGGPMSYSPDLTGQTIYLYKIKNNTSRTVDVTGESIPYDPQGVERDRGYFSAMTIGPYGEGYGRMTYYDKPDRWDRSRNYDISRVENRFYYVNTNPEGTISFLGKRWFYYGGAEIQYEVKKIDKDTVEVTYTNTSDRRLRPITSVNFIDQSGKLIIGGRPTSSETSNKTFEPGESYTDTYKTGFELEGGYSEVFVFIERCIEELDN